ncbi:hypothetical protein C8J56DRAFT_914664 [Mycena floridula]|nr:hypothetical protein C8J56DRAFT_914664 [Mycena floridula]
MAAVSNVSLPSSALAEKENVSAPQPNIKAAFEKVVRTSRKRTITTVQGDTVDISSAFDATPEVINAMRKRIIELEDALEATKQEPPAKRAKSSSVAPPANASAGPSTSKSTAAAAKADEKKRKLQLKKMFDRLKKDCKSDTCKFQGHSKTVKFDEVLEASEFDFIFGGKGTLIQPTPENKPKSTVTIIQFNSIAQIQGLFGDELKPLKGNRWTVGGIMFSKSIKQGPVDVAISSIEVNYAKNTMKCVMKFEVDEVRAAGRGSYYDDY